jgi:hypothetical protein
MTVLDTAWHSKRGLLVLLLLQQCLLVAVFQHDSTALRVPRTTTAARFEATAVPKAGAQVVAPTEERDVTDPIPRHRAMCVAFDAMLLEATTKGAAEVHAINSAVPAIPSAVDFVKKIRVWPDAKKRKPFGVLCVTFTFEGKKAAAAMSRRYWGRRCDRHVFITNSSDIVGVARDDALLVNQTGGEAWLNAWQKTRSAIRTLHEAPWIDEYEFAFFGGDDVMLVVENLRKMIDAPEMRYAHEAGAPLHFGHLSSIPHNSRFIAGAGYAMNTAAIHLMAARLDTPECNPNLRASAEDVYLSQCLQHVGVVPHDSRDIYGEDRFTVFAPVHHIEIIRKWNWVDWWVAYRDRQVPQGMDLMSRDFVLMHYLATWDIQQYGDILWPHDIPR